MKQRKRTPVTGDVIAVSLPELMAKLNCGRCTAEKVAAAAGARIKLGRRTLYHVGKIESYLLNQAENQADGKGA